MRRREFLEGAAGAVAWTAVSANSVMGANDRVSLGLIGCGSRSRVLLDAMKAIPGVEFRAVCDVYEPYMTRAKSTAGPQAQSFADFRKLLEQKDIDAVVIATSNHWHAIPSVLACEAGKDVYVEKPMTHNVKEGQVMVQTARRTKRIVAVGSQQRSAPHFREVEDLIQSGKLGEVRFVRVWWFKNRYPNMSPEVPDSAVPSGMDWDFYLGPAPKVPFNQNRFRNFRSYFDYAGGAVSDFGAHRLDTMHQIMHADTPKTVVAAGGRFATQNCGDVPDLVQATYEYPGFVCSYEICDLNAHGVGGRTPGRTYYFSVGEEDHPEGLAFYGTNGAVFADRFGYDIYPELTPDSRRRGSGKPQYAAERKWKNATDATELHVRNFIDCLRSRKAPNAPVEIGHKGANICHLCNIAYRTGRKLHWNGEKEIFENDPGANREISRQARAPWTQI